MFTISQLPITKARINLGQIALGQIARQAHNGYEYLPHFPLEKTRQEGYVAA
jgi:hypothetical protein